MKKLLLLTFLISMSSQAQIFGMFKRDSGGMGNGGHPYEIEFKSATKQVIKILKDENILKDPELQNINMYLLELNSNVMTVEVKRKNLKDRYGRIKCALNFPGENLIQINEECWEKIHKKIHLKLPFVLHELLGLTGDEVDNYKKSSLLTSSIDAFIRSLSEEIPATDARFSKYLAKDGAISEVVKFSQASLSYYFNFEGEFGLRPHQYQRLDVLCENLGYRFHVDEEVEISNYLIYSLEVKNGSVALSNTLNVDKVIKSVTCAK